MQNFSRRRTRENEQDDNDGDGAHGIIPAEVSEELVASVKKMGMDQDVPNVSQMTQPISLARVLGINSFMGFGYYWPRRRSLKRIRLAT